MKRIAEPPLTARRRLSAVRLLGRLAATTRNAAELTAVNRINHGLRRCCVATRATLASLLRRRLGQLRALENMLRKSRGAHWPIASAGFVRGALRNGRVVKGARALVVGAGGVGSAIAAALGKAGAAAMAVFDVNNARLERLAARLNLHYPALAIATGSNDPSGCDIVVIATPLGMHSGDPPPLDPSRVAPTTYVGEVVMNQDHPVSRGRPRAGLRATPDELRAVARIQRHR